MAKLTVLPYDKSDEIVKSFGKGGWIKLILRTIKHKNFEGAWIEYSFPWVVFDRGDSVAVLLHDVKRNEVLLVEQFRPAILRGIFELVAGTLQPGEDPEQCARREAQEEVGKSLGEVKWISTFFLSPGATSERIFLYYAEVSCEGEEGLLTGLVDEGENIKKRVVSFEDAMKTIEDGTIDDAKTIIALQWLRLQHM